MNFKALCTDRFGAMLSMLCLFVMLCMLSGCERGLKSYKTKVKFAIELLIVDQCQKH